MYLGKEVADAAILGLNEMPNQVLNQSSRYFVILTSLDVVYR